jgi:hypothetical protein
MSKQRKLFLLFHIMCPEPGGNSPGLCLPVTAFSSTDLEFHSILSAVGLYPEGMRARWQLPGELRTEFIIEGSLSLRATIEPPLNIVGAATAGHTKACSEVSRLELAARINFGELLSVDWVNDIYSMLSHCEPP